MSTFNRREYLASMLGAGLYLGASRQPLIAAENPPAPPLTTLGKTGIETSRLAFGTGVKSGKKVSMGTKLGFQNYVDLFIHAYERGITFYDLADWYGSHMYLREAMKTIPREKLTILTKVWWREDHKTPSELPTKERYRSMKKAFQRYQYECGTDVIDVVLLHCLTKRDWLEGMQPYMDALSELKEEGKVRALGVSCHDWGAMETAVDSDWVDVMLTRLNPKGKHMDNTPEKVVELMKKARSKGKGIIGMKIYGEGKLVDMREECMKYAQTNGVLDAMTIGVLSKEQIDENVALMAKYPVKS
jgi:predicted aldo/keto reductase-like oxidoreductase